MNQHDYYPPPPPTPGGRSPNSASFPYRQRALLGQTANSSSVVRSPGANVHVAISATTFSASTPPLYTPSAPSPLNPRTPAALSPPSSATSPGAASMQPYNPGQWSGRAQVSGSQMVFQQRTGGGPVNTREATGMEGSFDLLDPPHEEAEVSWKRIC